MFTEAHREENYFLQKYVRMLKKKLELSKVYKASHGNSGISTKDISITVANFEKIETEKIYIMATAIDPPGGMTYID